MHVNLHIHFKDIYVILLQSIIQLRIYKAGHVQNLIGWCPIGFSAAKCLILYMLKALSSEKWFNLTLVLKRTFKQVP